MMDPEIRAIIDKMHQDEVACKAANDEPTCEAWLYQPAIDRLVVSGFATIDEKATWGWKQRAWHEGRPSYHLCYKWTEAGKEACFRHRYSTPMSWAEDIHFKRTRHCVECGRDCYRKKVWASIGRFLCVCMSCGAKGHGLQDIDQQ